MTRLPAIGGSAVAILLLLPWAQAAAAPQVLGVVASAEARPLTCRDGTCSLYLSSFCILERREPPAPGTAYAPASGGAMTLLVTTAAGGRLRLPTAGTVTFESYAGYTAVRASLPEAALARLGGVAAALEVGARATLIPEPVPGDPDPLGPEEIALATGPWRVAAEPVFERGAKTPRAQAVARSPTGSCPSSESESVSYRASRRCSGATLPVRLMNRQGGSSMSVLKPSG